MAELSLMGHEAALVELADEQVMTGERLQDHIQKLEDIRADAVARNLGRQAEVSTRLLLHFTQEQNHRNGVFADIVAGQDFPVAELEESVAA